MKIRRKWRENIDERKISFYLVTRDTWIVQIIVDIRNIDFK